MSTIDSAPVLGSSLSDTLQGVWLFDPTYPEATSVQYLYGNTGRTESLGVENAGLQFLGRTRPVVDFGEAESQTVGLSFTIPFSPTHTAEVERLRAVVRARTTLCYRDGRGRILWGVLTGASITDTKSGSQVSGTLIMNAYTEAV
jgi:hypothetical protein